jgi:predicted DNA-binding transcriptional regulator AlpA
VAAAVDDRLMKRPEVLERLRISSRTLDRLTAEGQLEKVPVRGLIRYRESEVARIVASGTDGAA